MDKTWIVKLNGYIATVKAPVAETAINETRQLINEYEDTQDYDTISDEAFECYEAYDELIVLAS